MERERNERAMAPAKRGHWQCTSAAASRRGCDAYHEQRAAHREALERGTADAPERLGALPVVTVPAASIVVAEGGPNYRPVVKSKGKQEKQARRRATATATAGGRRWSRRWRVSRRWWARSRKIRTSRRCRTTSAPRGSGARGARARRYASLALGQQAAVELQDTQSIINCFAFFFVVYPVFLRPGFMQRRVLVQYAYCECYE